ncbi:MAG TPA: TolC family protein, partial [Saprospiraceae bacterium]|nr:TolC family protein [Saprospiraceae bacterium]
FEVQKAQEAVRQSKALFYPSLLFDANYTRATGGRRIEFPVGDLVNPIYANLNQLNELVQPGAPDYPTNIPNVKEQFLPDNFYSTKVNIAYPLYNSDLRYNKQIQEQLYEGQSAQKAAREHELRYQITDAYLQYLKALEAEKIILNSRNVLAELRRFNESLVKNNVATRDVVATADYELSKTDNEIIKLHRAQDNLRAYFNTLLNRDLQSEIVADSVLLRSPAGTYELNTLIQTAFASREEFNALRAGMNAAETDVKRNAANLKIPDFYLGGELGFQGFAYTFSGEQAYALGQVGLTYEIFDGGLRRSKTQEARLEAERMRTQYSEAQQQIALQVTQAWNEFQAAQNSYTTTQAGLKAAEETFRIVTNKYRASQALLIEFLDAENRVTTARLQQLLAWSDVLMKEAALRKAAGL